MAIVGAGPAGATAAFLLARQGRRTLLVDRATFPRFKVCGCCLNRNALTTLQRVGLADTVAASVPYSALCLTARGRSAFLPLPAGRVISRELWDAKLIERACAAGAQFLPGTTASLTPATAADRRGLRLRQGGQRVRAEAKVVLAADGLAGGVLERDDESPTHIAAGSRLGAGAILEVDNAAYAPGTITMAVGRGGYVGLVRLEDGRLDLAAALDAHAVAQAGGLAPLVTAILREAGAAPLPVEQARWKGTPPLTRRRVRPGAVRVFALGDAIGYIEPFTGEGMAWALASAAAIPPFVTAALAGWDNRLVTRWQAMQRRQIGRRQWLCRALSAALRHPGLVGTAVALGRLLPVVGRPIARFINRPSPVLDT